MKVNVGTLDTVYAEVELKPASPWKLGAAPSITADIDEVGFSPGVANLVTGTERGRRSTRRRLITLRRYLWSLGGQAPFVVLEDADEDQTVEAAVEARFANCGQVSICNEMVLVHESIADEFTEKLLERVKSVKLGDTFDESVTMGPIANGRDLEKIDAIVQETVRQGATPAASGKRPTGEGFEKGYWYEPTVLTNVTHQMAAAREEIFGPVLPIVRFGSFEEAVSIINASELGLSAYLYTNDYRKLMQAIQVMEVGTVFLN
ncbi:hypothetical protein PC122_g6066 [Phytophthora cactorum]|nr:hypothetical protein PC122_g6066 [Phytophthora cactorum]